MTDIKKLKDILDGPKEILQDVCPRPGACYCDGACKKNRMKFVRSDLPKEVDLGELKREVRKACPHGFYKTQEEVIDHLIALGGD